ncbi:MAG: serpin family protein [Clostridia bacterium]|nr:serpin family protein [Clostridia bacterium]
MKRRFRNAVLLLLIACMLMSTVTMSGCMVSIKAEELSADYTRTATEEGKVTDAFVAAMADFSMTLANTTVAMEKETKANHLVSPLSAMICLSMLANGAKGETLTQMETVLGMKIDDLNKALYAYTENLYVGEDCKVSLADSIWYRDGDSFTVKEEFLQTCADWYKAQQYAAPFDESTRKDINNWAKKYTDGMIDSILEEPIPADTVMYVINALVFDAKWQEEYEKSDIKSRTFTSLDGSTADVEMMHSEESTYLTVEGGQGFARKYKGGAYSFVGLLPDEGVDIYDFAASLDGEAWNTMWGAKIHETVKVRIPEFTYESSMKLTPVLQSMGMTDLFDDVKADLSGIGGSAAGELYCSGVYQKTYIEVNRHGTKAAAISWGVNGDKAAAPEEMKYVYLDRPFVYAIVDNATGLPLFVGVVTDL